MVFGTFASLPLLSADVHKLLERLSDVFSYRVHPAQPLLQTIFHSRAIFFLEALNCAAKDTERFILLNVMCYRAIA